MGSIIGLACCPSCLTCLPSVHLHDCCFSSSLCIIILQPIFLITYSAAKRRLPFFQSHNVLFFFFWISNLLSKALETFISPCSSLSPCYSQRAFVVTATASRATSAHTWISWRAYSRRLSLPSHQQSPSSRQQSSQAPHQPQTSGITLQPFPSLLVRIRVFCFVLWGGRELWIVFFSSG